MPIDTSHLESCLGFPLWYVCTVHFQHVHRYICRYKMKIIKMSLLHFQMLTLENPYNVSPHVMIWSIYTIRERRKNKMFLHFPIHCWPAIFYCHHWKIVFVSGHRHHLLAYSILIPKKCCSQVKCKRMEGSEWQSLSHHRIPFRSIPSFLLQRLLSSTTKSVFLWNMCL